MRRTTFHVALLCAAAFAATATPALAAGTGAASPDSDGATSQFDPGQIGAGSPTEVGGGTSPTGLPDAITPVEEPAPGDVAVLIHGVALAPAGAPDTVKRAIRAANSLRRRPYVWGGGHASFRSRGYDCSGAVSYVLHAAGLLDWPRVSGALARWGAKGRGQWITVYANRGHAFMVIAGLRFDTSGAGQNGPRWRSEPRWMRSFHVRHPAGF